MIHSVVPGRLRLRTLAVLAASALLSTLIPSCDDSSCDDADGDLRGVGCKAGADCDDDDPTRASNCDRPPSDCEQDPRADGCPCIGGRKDCYGGDPETLEVGSCLAGRNACIDERWGECIGQVLPAGERCNDIDDDCDGRVDEFVRSPCGGCDNTCIGDIWGVGAAAFEPTDSLIVTDDGELMLALRPFTASDVWVANGDDASVSRIDPALALETARYRVAGTGPSRVSVDQLGDAWVLSPSAAGRSMLTRIASEPTRCGTAQPPRTSTGPDDVLPLGQDACVVLAVAVGQPAEVASTLSIDGQLGPDGFVGGHPWVGYAATQRVAELDPDTGEELRSIELPGTAPHTSTFDPFGGLWIATRDGHLVHVDLSMQPPVVSEIEIALPCFALEAITADSQGRLFMSGFACENVIAYDPATGEVEDVSTGSVLTTRGIAITDGDGFVVHTAGSLSRFAPYPLEMGETYDLATSDNTPVESIGAAADGLGHIWVISSGGGPDGRGLATRFNTADNVVDAEVVVGRGPRGLGDFTGSQLYGVSDTEGSASHVFRGCRYENPGNETLDEPTEWTRAHLVMTGAPGGSVELLGRHAQSIEELDQADFISIGTAPEQSPPFALEFPDGGYLEVKLVLRTQERGSTPRVHSVGVEWTCPGPE